MYQKPVTDLVNKVLFAEVVLERTENRRSPQRQYLRVIIAHRQKQTAQYPYIGVEASSGHVPYVIDYIHLTRT